LSLYRSLRGLFSRAFLYSSSSARLSSSSSSRSSAFCYASSPSSLISTFLFSRGAPMSSMPTSFKRSLLGDGERPGLSTKRYGVNSPLPVGDSYVTRAEPCFILDLRLLPGLLLLMPVCEVMSLPVVASSPTLILPLNFCISLLSVFVYSSEYTA